MKIPTRKKWGQNFLIDPNIINKIIAVLNLKKDRFNENRTTYNLEKEKLGEDIAELRKALSTGTTVQYIDRESGQLITTTSRSTRQSFERQLDIALKSRDKISIKLETVKKTRKLLALERPLK